MHEMKLIAPPPSFSLQIRPIAFRLVMNRPIRTMDTCANFERDQTLAGLIKQHGYKNPIVSYANG